MDFALLNLKPGSLRSSEQVGEALEFVDSQCGQFIYYKSNNRWVPINLHSIFVLRELSS
jgi:hypothetical protein